MTADERNDLLVGYLEDELDAAEREQVEALLERDAAARETLEAYRGLGTALAGLGAPEPSAAASDAARAAILAAMSEGADEASDADASAPPAEAETTAAPQAADAPARGGGAGGILLRFLPAAAAAAFLGSFGLFLLDGNNASPARETADAPRQMLEREAPAKPAADALAKKLAPAAPPPAPPAAGAEGAPPRPIEEAWSKREADKGDAPAKQEDATPGGAERAEALDEAPEVPGAPPRGGASANSELSLGGKAAGEESARQEEAEASEAKSREQARLRRVAEAGEKTVSGLREDLGAQSAPGRGAAPSEPAPTDDAPAPDAGPGATPAQGSGQELGGRQRAFGDADGVSEDEPQTESLARKAKRGRASRAEPEDRFAGAADAPVAGGKGAAPASPPPAAWIVSEGARRRLYVLGAGAPRVRSLPAAPEKERRSTLRVEPTRVPVERSGERPVDLDRSQERADLVAIARLELSGAAPQGYLGTEARGLGRGLRDDAEAEPEADAKAEPEAESAPAPQPTPSASPAPPMATPQKQPTPAEADATDATRREPESVEKARELSAARLRRTAALLEFLGQKAEPEPAALREALRIVERREAARARARSQAR